jgi:uncharacterized membrane protein
MSNPIKPTLKTEFLPILLVLLAIMASFYFYFHFPDSVPIHWNIAGEVDNYGSRTTGAFLFPAIILGMYLLFLALPYIDPKKKRYEQFRKVYHVFKNILVFFMVGIYFITSLNALGYRIPVGLWTPLLVGLLFVIMGNYMGKIKSNWFIGIRTPWTLSSEEVWNKTHRFGGKIFIIGGILMMIMYLLPAKLQLILFVFIISFILLGTIGYSYILYRTEEKKKGR